MAALSFVASSSRRSKRKSSPSLTTIAVVAALAGGAAYVFMPAGISIGPAGVNIGERLRAFIPHAADAPASAPAAVSATKPLAHKSSDPAP
ncbi:MAG: hypothetical protein ABI740_10245, partial [Alphaproteobacteria bacterium]